MLNATRHRAAQHLQHAWLERGALAIGLLPLAWLYGLVVGLRRWLYRLGIEPTIRLPVPVIVVGNLIAGGAGKTPTVMAIVELLRREGRTPGIVSRGHGRSGSGSVSVEVRSDSAVAAVGDEPLMMHRRTGAPVWVGRDRVATARELLRCHPEVDVIVADDGLQHLRLARTVDVLVFDERGAGNGWLLPAGPLREPMPARVPARSLVLYNAPSASTPLPGTLVRRSLAGVAELSAWRIGNPTLSAPEFLRGRPLLAAAGVAHPERFFGMLRAAGLAIVPLPLPDHFDYPALPWPAETADVITTEKDAVKLDPGRLGRTRVWVAALDFAPPAAFDSAMMALLGGTPNAAAAPFGTDHGNATP